MNPQLSPSSRFLLDEIRKLFSEHKAELNQLFADRNAQWDQRWSSRGTSSPPAAPSAAVSVAPATGVVPAASIPEAPAPVASTLVASAPVPSACISPVSSPSFVGAASAPATSTNLLGSTPVDEAASASDSASSDLDAAVYDTGSAESDAPSFTLVFDAAATAAFPFQMKEREGDLEDMAVGVFVEGALAASCPRRAPPIPPRLRRPRRAPPRAPRLRRPWQAHGRVHRLRQPRRAPPRPPRPRRRRRTPRRSIRPPRRHAQRPPWRASPCPRRAPPLAPRRRTCISRVRLRVLPRQGRVRLRPGLVCLRQKPRLRLHLAARDEGVHTEAASASVCVRSVRLHRRPRATELHSRLALPPPPLEGGLCADRAAPPPAPLPWRASVSSSTTSSSSGSTQVHLTTFCPSMGAALSCRAVVSSNKFNSSNSVQKVFDEMLLQRVVLVRDKGVSSCDLPDNCLMNCLTVKPCYFSLPLSNSWDAVICWQPRQPWPPPVPILFMDYTILLLGCSATHYVFDRGRNRMLFEEMFAVQSVMQQSVFAALADKGRGPYILKFEQVDISPKPPWYVSVQLPQPVELWKCFMRLGSLAVVPILVGPCSLDGYTSLGCLMVMDICVSLLVPQKKGTELNLAIGQIVLRLFQWIAHTPGSVIFLPNSFAVQFKIQVHGVHLQPIIWPSLDWHTVDVQLENILFLLIACFGSKRAFKCEISQLQTMPSYSVWVRPPWPPPLKNKNTLLSDAIKLDFSLGMLFGSGQEVVKPKPPWSLPTHRVMPILSVCLRLLPWPSFTHDTVLVCKSVGAVQSKDSLSMLNFIQEPTVQEDAEPTLPVTHLCSSTNWSAAHISVTSFQAIQLYHAILSFTYISIDLARELWLGRWFWESIQHLSVPDKREVLQCLVFLVQQQQLSDISWVQEQAKATMLLHLIPAIRTKWLAAVVATWIWHRKIKDILVAQGILYLAHLCTDSVHGNCSSSWWGSDLKETYDYLGTKVLGDSLTVSVGSSTTEINSRPNLTVGENLKDTLTPILLWTPLVQIKLMASIKLLQVSILVQCVTPGFCKQNQMHNYMYARI